MTTGRLGYNSVNDRYTRSKGEIMSLVERGELAWHRLIWKI